jgi:26S proteasome regulatory subunit N3
VFLLYTYTHTVSTLEIKRNFSLLERAVETIEARFTTRVLRTLPSIRRRLTSDILAQVISDYYGPSK